MSKICIIKQPAGLGDILFTSKIRKMFTDIGFHVINPVIPEYYWIDEYLDGDLPILNNNFKYFDLYNNFNDLTPKTFKIDNEEILILPLVTADRLFPGSVMDAKYKLLNINFNDWSNFFSFKRNFEKENDLYYNVLKLKDGEEYIFVNSNMGSPPNSVNININISTNIKKIDLSFYDGFSLFDWIKVLECAKEIHFVESSLNYILEVLNIESEKVYVYSKHNPPNFFHVKHLFSKNWNYIY